MDPESDQENSENDIAEEGDILSPRETFSKDFESELGAQVDKAENNSQEPLESEMAEKIEETHVRFDLPDDGNSDEIMSEKQAEKFGEINVETVPTISETLEDVEVKIVETKLTRQNSKVDFETEGNLKNCEERSESDQSEDEDLVPMFSRRLRRDSDKVLIRKENLSDESSADESEVAENVTSHSEDLKNDLSEGEVASTRRVSFDRAANVTHIVPDKSFDSDTSD